VHSNNPEDPPLSEEPEEEDAGGRDPGLSGFGWKRKQPFSSAQASKKAKKKMQSASRHRAVDQRKAAIPGASNSAK